MKKWSKQHHNLFAMLGFFLLLCIVAFFFLSPLRSRISDDKAYISETKSKLRKSGWPLDAERLQKLLDLKKSILEKTKTSETAYKATGIRNKSTLLLQECTNAFQKRIKKIFVNPSDFSKEITRLDYQDEYNTIRDKLVQKNIYFSEDSLNMGTDSDSTKIYPMVLQIWFVDEILNLATKNSLEIVNDQHAKVKSEQGRLKKVAKVQLLPVRPYSLYEKEQKIYILEFPLRMSLRGSLMQFSGFLRDIHSGGKYFPVSKLQIRAIPEWQNSGSESLLKNSLLDIEIECSAFFRHSDSPPAKLKLKKIKVIPAGA
jgi:hypothetical protein